MSENEVTALYNYNPWNRRTNEVAYLLNPAFLAEILHWGILGYQKQESAGMPFLLTFLLPAIVLHEPTRQLLPKNAQTSMAVWMTKNPRVKVGFASRLQSLAPLVRESLIFAGQLEAFEFTADGRLKAQKLTGTKRIEYLTEDVQTFPSRCQLVGQWFAIIEEPTTICELWGITV